MNCEKICTIFSSGMCLSQFVKDLTDKVYRSSKKNKLNIIMFPLLSPKYRHFLKTNEHI